LLLRQRPQDAAVIAAAGYMGLLIASLVTIRVAGISAAEVGFRTITSRSIVIGAIAGILVIAPVWHWPSFSMASPSWVLVAVMVEEVAFRGVLFALLRRAGGLPLAIAGSTVVFTVAHAGSAGWQGLGLVGLAGLYLGVLRTIRGDLWASGIAHFLMDLVSLP